jgi:hypothetical protein
VDLATFRRRSTPGDLSQSRTLVHAVRGAAASVLAELKTAG